ncbi:hypothetical protein Y032_0068g254 [Ancylostoma ceylanicum]|uniref:Trafficking protein particle complex subunit 13 N-terminal domain-containing protein n=1 Tax=Ancylostoma ceylanicum TaxID=53326 RepID=A0A016TYY5_9BILA|nr:hypothetical protein Y032_0068g254 [Ancylostoma ceylanicum]
MGESLQSSNQLLSLKVIRLSRPKRSEGSPLQVDPVDPSRFSQLINAALASGEKRYDTPIGEYLIAPLMFENIYLGETFTFYMNVVNESDQKVTDVSVKCELQTNSQRVNLTSSVQDVILEPSQSSGQIITHEVKEIGQHILICSVNYKTSSDEKMYFRKFFKFPVGKPIDVKTKFYNAEALYLEWAELSSFAIGQLDELTNRKVRQNRSPMALPTPKLVGTGVRVADGEAECYTLRGV